MSVSVAGQITCAAALTASTSSNTLGATNDVVNVGQSPISISSGAGNNQFAKMASGSLTLLASTPQTIDLTALPSGTGTLNFATWKLMYFYNPATGAAVAVTVEPDSSNGATMPTVTVPGSSPQLLTKLLGAGVTVDATHKSIKFDPGRTRKRSITSSPAREFGGESMGEAPDFHSRSRPAPERKGRCMTPTPNYLVGKVIAITADGKTMYATKSDVSRSVNVIKVTNATSGGFQQFRPGIKAARLDRVRLQRRRPGRARPRQGNHRGLGRLPAAPRGVPVPHHPDQGQLRRGRRCDLSFDWESSGSF